MDGTARGIEASATPLWRQLDFARPYRSARRVTTYAQLAGFGLLAGAFSQVAIRFQGGTLNALYVGVYVFFLCVILLRLFAASAALARSAARVPTATETPLYTILCPLRQEAAVVTELAEALSQLNYPGVMAQRPPRARSPKGLIRSTLDEWNTGRSRR